MQVAKMLSRCWPSVAVLVSGLLGGNAAIYAQEAAGRWQVDSKASLVWWQIDPHYQHLWATTCPNDPSWQPGEGSSAGFFIDFLRRPQTVAAGVSDPRVPLYPRRRVRSLCRQAVRGEITVADADGWGDVTGNVVVVADSLVTGLNMRDKYARERLLQTARYPEITFTLDSLVSVQPGDTLRATAVGVFELRGVRLPLTAEVEAQPQPGGALRVLAKWSMDAPDLIHTYGMSKYALGMGVVLKAWKTVWMGADLLLRPQAQSAAETESASQGGR